MPSKAYHHAEERPFETPPAAAPQDRLARLEGRTAVLQRFRLALARDEVERLRREAQSMMALHRRVEIPIDCGAGGLAPCGVGRCAQLVLQRDQDLQPMAGNERFGNAVIVERLCRAGEKGRPVLDM